MATDERNTSHFRFDERFTVALSALAFICLVVVTIITGLCILEFPGISPKYLVVFPALLLGITIFFVVSKAPEVLVHLCLMGAILDQWEKLAFTGIPYLTATKLLFLVGLAVLLLRSVVSRENRPPMKFPAAALAYLPFSLLCLVSALAFAYSLRAGLRWVTAPVTLPLFCIVLTQFVPSEKAALRVLKGFVLYSFFPMAVASLEYVLGIRLAGPTDFQILGIADIFRVGANYDNPNDFVVLMIFSMPILLLWMVQSKKLLPRLLLLAGFLLQAFILWKTYSRSGYLAVGFSLVAIAWLGRGGVRRFGIAVSLLACVVFMCTPDVKNRLITMMGIRTESEGQAQALASVNIRKQLLEVGTKEFMKHPFFGVGFSNIGPLAQTYSSVLYSRLTVECVYLEILAEMGLIGFSAYCLFLIVAFRAMIKGLERCRGRPEVEPIFVGLAAAFCGYAFKGLFDTTLTDNLPWVLLGVMVHLGHEQHQINSTESSPSDE